MSDDPKWLRFEQLPRLGKTNRFRVLTGELTGDQRTELGLVSWHGAWRRYAFSPAPGTLYEAVCLRDIANFCDRLTQEWRREKAEARS